MLILIGTGILEVCERSDSVADRDGLDSRNLSSYLLAPESWKSASGLVVSQTDAFDSGGSCESKYMLKLIGTAPVSWKSASGLIVSQTDAFDSGGSWGSKSKLKLIGTGILEVCEWSYSVADRRFRLGRVLGWKSKLKLIGTGILEVCEWSGSVADRSFRLGRVLGVEI